MFIFRRVIKEDGSLRITNISQSDAGRYTCVAQNIFGTSSSSGSLVVKGTLLLVGFHYLLNREFKSFLRLEKQQAKHEIDHEIYSHFMFPQL